MVKSLSGSVGVCVLPALQVSYMILQRVSPVTHSVGNSLKRVVVIVASVLVFRNPMSTQNAIGATWRCCHAALMP